MRITRGFGLLVIALVFAAARASAADVDVVPDVVYGHKDGMALTFDVLTPKSGANGAAVIYMVSGGWISTYAPPERTAANPQLAALLDKGFTVIALRHGSSPKYVIPEIVADVRRAVRYIKHHARDWGIDPARLGLHGASAGGHLSLTIGTAPDLPDGTATEPFLQSDNRVASVVAYFPPTDLRSWARGPAPATPGSFPALNFDTEKAPEHSPILHVTADDPPTLLIHGDSDRLVPISHSQTMYAALQEKGVRSELITIPGAGHGFRGDDAAKANAALVRWFEQTLLGSRTAATSH